MVSYKITMGHNHAINISFQGLLLLSQEEVLQDIDNWLSLLCLHGNHKNSITKNGTRNGPKTDRPMSLKSILSGLWINDFHLSVNICFVIKNTLSTSNFIHMFILIKPFKSCAW